MRTPKRQNRRINSPSDRKLNPIKVFCRLKPTDLESSCIKILNANIIETEPPKKTISYRMDYTKKIQHNFEKVFDDETPQDQIFKDVGFDLIKEVLNGNNALIFTYGVTGSGKTHSILGHKSDPGIMIRSVDVLFNSIGSKLNKKFKVKSNKINGYMILNEDEILSEEQRNDYKGRNSADISSKIRHKQDTKSIVTEAENVGYSVFVSYYEIYQESINDLLIDYSSSPLTQSSSVNRNLKSIREDKDGNIYVASLLEIECRSSDEVYNIILSGMKRRHIASTALNDLSSRSHAIFNIKVVQVPDSDYQFEDPSIKYISSQLSIVDLAGAERLNRTRNVGERVQEAGKINNSLMSLRSCVEAIRDNCMNDAKRVVPYRNSKITHLFKGNFEQACNIRILICVNPANIEFDETINVLRFAESSQEIEYLPAPEAPQLTKIRKIVDSDDNNLINEFREYVDVEIEDDVKLDESICEKYDYMIGFLKKRHKYLKRSDTLVDKVDQQIMLMINNEIIYCKSDIEEMSDKYRNCQNENAKLKNKIRDLKRDKVELKERIVKRDKENEISFNDKLNDIKNQYERKIRNEKLSRYKSEGLNAKMTDKIDNIAHILCQSDANSEMNINEIPQDRVVSINGNRKNINGDLKVTENYKKKKKNLVLLNDASSIETDTTIDDEIYTRTPISQSIAEFNAKSKQKHFIPKDRNFTPKTPINRINVNKQSQVKSTPKSKTNKNMSSTPFKTPVRMSKINNIKVGSRKITTNLPGITKRRRSQSVDVWVDHTDPNSKRNEYTLQPVMKKSINTSKLTADVTKKASKYLLTHEGPDTDGEMNTKIITGSITPTSTGGRSIVFESVEKISCTSPGVKTIRSNGDLQPNDFEGQWTDVEERCHVAVEGHSIE